MKNSAIVLSASLVACGPSFEPASYVKDVRILAVKAEPPEVAPDGHTSLRALVAHPEGPIGEVTWSACTRPVAPGMQIINPDCFVEAPTPYLVPLGRGNPIEVIIPSVTPTDFAPPDASGGLYLPLRVRAESGRRDAAYRLRLAYGLPPNHNPQLDTVIAARGTGPEQSLDETSPPLPVRPGDQVTLHVTFKTGSAETYQQIIAGQSRTVTEILTVAWFSDGGSLSEAVTGPDKPNTIWRADTHLPTRGLITLWIVARDERGGTDYKQLIFQLQ